MPLFKEENGVIWTLKRSFLGLEWCNASGGRHNFTPIELKSRSLFEAESFSDFRDEIIARYLLNEVLLPNLDYGWISRSGDFYSCVYSKHDDLMELGLGVSPYQQEADGWLKVTFSWQENKGNRHWLKWCFTKSIFDVDVTKQQKRMLSKLGLSYEEPAMRVEDISYDQVFPKGNQPFEKLRTKHRTIIEEEQKKRKPVRISSPKELAPFLEEPS